MTIEVQVQDGKVTITVGGRPVADDANDEVKNQSVLEAKPGIPKAPKGKNAASHKAAREISPARRRPTIGGSGSSDKAAIGGSGSSDKAAIGGGGPASGVLVIGPIVIACSALADAGKKGGTGSSDKPAIGSGAPLSGAVVIGPIVVGAGGDGYVAKDDADTKPSKAIAVNPLAEDE